MQSDATRGVGRVEWGARKDIPNSSGRRLWLVGCQQVEKGEKSGNREISKMRKSLDHDYGNVMVDI